MSIDLQALVKRKLNITGSDEATDARVDDAIASVMPALARRCGIDPSDLEAMDAFHEGGELTGLLANACFYEWNHALDEFWANYGPDVQAVRIMLETEAMSDAQQET